jgi:hypothetical protein
LADRDIQAAQARDLDEDRRFNIAYNGALQASVTALAAEGYRLARGSSKHHYAIQSPALTIRADASTVGLLDRFRQKRNTAEYEAAGTVSNREAEEMLGLAKDLRTRVDIWLKEKHPELLG